MDNVYHPLVEQIINLLKQENCWFETFEHEEVRTSEQAAQVRTGYSLHQGAKAIILKVYFPGNEERFVMLVIPGDCRFDTKKVKEILNAKNLRFATEEEVIKVTNGVLPGGVPPFGNLFNLEVFADKTLFENEKIIFNAGDKKFSIASKSSDYQKLVSPKITSLL